MSAAVLPIRERLIVASISEIKDHGIIDFSIRRVAAACGVSCAAPYKHFKNKNDLILEMIRYINRKWREIQDGILASSPDDPEKLLIEISMSYVRFLVENPDFQSIINMNGVAMEQEQIREKAKISEVSADLIRRYCESKGMNDDDETRKTYVVRALIYGAAILINSGTLPDTAKTYGFIEESIAREFRLP